MCTLQCKIPMDLVVSMWQHYLVRGKLGTGVSIFPFDISET